MDYTDLYNFQSSNGIIVPSDVDLLTNIQDKFKEIFGSDLDVSPSTPVGRLIETVCVLVKSSLGVTAQSANQFNLNVATGHYIDSLAELFNLSRRPGTKTRIPITVWMRSETDSIPAGSLMMNAKDELFAVDEEISPTTKDEDSGLWIGHGTASSNDYGPIDGTKGTVNKIATNIYGWEKVLNEGDPLATGTLVETDDEFRKRILNSRETGVSFYRHLLSKLNRIEEVRSICVLENNNLVDVVKKGVTIQGHSVFICIDHDTGTEVSERIVRAIAETLPVGVSIENGIDDDSVQLVERHVEFDCDTSKVAATVRPATDIYYYKPSYVSPIVMLKVFQTTYTGKDLEGDIKSAISAYVTKLPIGETLRGILVANAVMQTVSGIVVMSSGVSLDAVLTEDTTALEFVESTGYQKFVPNSDRMRIEIVQIPT